MIEIECCSYNDRLITMDPPEQLRLPMFIVGSMRASEFDVFVVDAGGQLRSATPSSSLLGIGPLQHVAHSFRSCIRRASLRPPRPALKLFHQYLRLPRRSRLKCGKLHAHTKLKAVLAAFRTLLKFVLEKTTTMTTTTRRILAKKLRKVVSPSFSASDNEYKNENEKA